MRHRERTATTTDILVHLTIQRGPRVQTTRVNSFLVLPQGQPTSQFIGPMWTSVEQVSIRLAQADDLERNIRETFQMLAQRWRDETAGLSSPSQKLLNENYLSILRLDADIVVPLILQELAARPDDWFLALKLLTRENPVKPEVINDFRLVTKAWLDWGKSKNYL